MTWCIQFLSLLYHAAGPPGEAGIKRGAPYLAPLSIEDQGAFMSYTAYFVNEGLAPLAARVMETLLQLLEPGGAASPVTLPEVCCRAVCSLAATQTACRC